MTKKIAALAALVLLLLTQRPHAQGGQARIYFVDVGTGASTLIVSPAGKTLLVDGGPPGSGAKISGLLATLGITTIDYTVITHYHIDHMGGMIEMLNAGKVAGGIAYDNGDGADVQPPGTSTSSSSTRGTYLNYVAATVSGGATRQTAVPGNGIDLGGGMKATFVAAGGHLLSGGSVPITNSDLNSESISTLIEYNNFDYLVSGDLTGGGSTSTAKTPDVETYVAQMVGDVDVVQLDHHGSTTANNQTFLSALKAEVAFAQTGETNTFGHPNRETANKYLNTPDTAGVSFAGTGVPAPGGGPAFYQNEASPAGDDRVTQQGYTGAAAGHAGQGTVLLSTDGTTTYSLSSFDDGGTRLPAALHTYSVDGVPAGITTDFKPTVVVQTSPVVPLSTDSVTITAAVNDRESPISDVSLTFSVNGIAQAPIAMTLAAGVYQATIPAQPDGTRLDYTVSGTAGSQTSAFSLGYFSGVTPIASLRALNTKGEPRYNGYPARIQGTVTASGFSSGTNDDYVQDATGAVNVYKSTDGPTPFTSTMPGQVVEARGRVGFNGGRLRLDLTESVERTSSPFGVAIIVTNPAPAPLVTTFSTLSSNTESFEGQLVSIPNVSLVSGTFPTTSQPLDTFVTVTDGTATFSLKLDHDTDADGFTPGATFTAVGIIQQDDYLRPFDSGYNIAPRNAADLGATAPPPPPLLTIADARVDAVTNADGDAPPDTIPDLLGQVVKVRGVVTSIDFRGGSGIEYYIQDATGGIDLFSTSLNAGPFNFGDSVEATGTVTQFNGLTELAVTSVSFLSAGPAAAPQVVTMAQLADGVGEALEGHLIRVNDVLITGGTFGAPGTSNNLTITDRTGTGVLRVDSDTNIDGTPTPGGVVSISGVLGQFDSTAPFDSGYQLLPRSLDDVELTACPVITIGGTLGGGTVGSPYSQSLTASGGTSPYSFSVAGGAVPGGLSLSNDGVLAGTPGAPGTFTFTVAASAADGCLGIATRSVTIVSPSPALSASPLTLAFGPAALGTSPTLPVTLTNTGGVPLVLDTPATITGTDASHFLVAMPASLTLAPGTSATATVTFVPTTAGPKSATLTITSNGGTATIALTGTGNAPSGGGIVISEFRTRGSAGTGANDEFVEIYNNSDAPIDISGYRLVGSNNTGGGTTTPRATVPAGVVLPARTHYLFVNTTATTGYSLPVPGNKGYTTGFTDDGGVAIFDATGAVPLDALDAVGMSTGSAFKEGTVLAPMSGTTNQSYQRKAGSPLGTLQDSGDNSLDFQLLNGVSPNIPNPENIVLIGSPTSLDFGGVLLPQARTLTATVKNLLIASVTLNTPAVTGADSSMFGIGGPSATTLAGGATATIAVTFQPLSTGAKAAALSVTSSNGGSLSIALQGSGLGGISVAPASIDFGSIESGSTADRTVTITNGNPTEVTLITPFGIAGDVADFTAGAPGSSTIAGGDSTTAIVTFHATALGSKNAIVTLASTNGGTRTVTLSAVSVDTTPPRVTVPADITREAIGAATAVTFTSTALDLVDGSLASSCTPASGSGFPVGATSVSCTATDAHGNTGTSSFVVTVTDHTAPTVTVPADITLEATGGATAVTFTSTAADLVDGSVASTCAPAPGFGFPVGTTPVNCTATDAHGNTGTGRFSVTITDQTAPAVTVPADITATATTPAGATVTFMASAFDIVDGTRTVVCAPASGSTFPIGTTTVACSAPDTHGNTGTGSFIVRVVTAPRPGLMTGDATIKIGSVTHSFDFTVQESGSGVESGTITYHVKTVRPGPDQQDEFVATTVGGVTFYNVPGVTPGTSPASGVDTVTFTGTGSWNGRSGYTFDARAIDAGEPGRGRDVFAITIREASGTVVASVDATITGGNIDSRPLR